MKLYKILSIHEIYEDNFKNGEGAYSHMFQMDNTIEADTPKEAIEKYFETFLFYDFDFDSSDINEDGMSLFYSVLVNDDVAQATESEVKEWKNGKLDLFSDRVTVFVNELVPVKIK